MVRAAPAVVRGVPQPQAIGGLGRDKAVWLVCVCVILSILISEIVFFLLGTPQTCIRKCQFER